MGKEVISYEYHHTYVNGDRRADVVRKMPGGVWGIEMLKNNTFYKRELYEGHSENYAEDAAENYVFGIKN